MESSYATEQDRNYDQRDGSAKTKGYKREPNRSNVPILILNGMKNAAESLPERFFSSAVETAWKTQFGATRAQISPTCRAEQGVSASAISGPKEGRWSRMVGDVGKSVLF